MSLLHCAGSSGCRLMPTVWRQGVGLCEPCAVARGWTTLAQKSVNPREKKLSLAARLQELREEFPLALLHAEQEPVVLTVDARVEPDRPMENEFKNIQQAEMWYVNGLPSETPF